MTVRRALLTGMGCLCLAAPSLAADRNFETQKVSIQVRQLTDKLVQPWGLDFLPDGRIIVTEKEGRLRIVSGTGHISAPIGGVPDVHAYGQGGLLDVTLHPEFARNRLVYLSFSESGDGGTSSTAVARGRLNDSESALTATEILFRQEPKTRGGRHFGSRVVFAPEGQMFVGIGDRGSAAVRRQAQDLNSHIGKVVRLLPDGQVPGDNPFVGVSGARPEIWSLGHRNIQGAAIHPVTGQLWAIEHGPRGGDEINIARAGANYGWPIVSHGTEYSGLPVGSGRKSMAGMEDPLVTWTPVIAPGGMTFYYGPAFPEWEGNLLISGLRSQALIRLELEGDRVVHEERLLEDLEYRIRDVAVGSDGAVHAITDEWDGKILRITRAR